MLFGKCCIDSTPNWGVAGKCMYPRLLGRIRAHRGAIGGKGLSDKLPYSEHRMASEIAWFA